MIITLEDEDQILIHIHGFERDELEPLPGEMKRSPEGNEWKQVRIKNLEMVFFLKPRK